MIMAESTTAPDETEVPWPFTACPACGGNMFSAQGVEVDVLFVCVGCAATWRYVVGYLVFVPMETEDHGIGSTG